MNGRKQSNGEGLTNPCRLQTVSSAGLPENEPTKPSRDCIDRVLQFLPYFADEEFRYLYGARGFVCTFSADIDAFIDLLREAGFNIFFDWQAWREKAERYIQNPDLIKGAGLEDLQKLLTYIIEKDRQQAGYLISLIRDDFILMFLQRLKVLHKNK